MSDSLMEEFEQTDGKHNGIFVIQNKESQMVLGIGEIRSEDESALCVFKTAMDAEEYLHNWMEDPENWEAFGSTDHDEGLEMLEEASKSYTHVTINPPLVIEKPFMIMSMRPFIDGYKFFPGS